MSRLALSMSDRTELWERLGLVGRVLKLQAIVIWSLRLLIAGLVVDCVWLAGSRFLPYGVRPTFLLIAPAALAARWSVCSSETRSISFGATIRWRRSRSACPGVS